MTLIDEYLDRYLKIRFNIQNYMIVLYKYPDDTNEAYDNIYIKYLKPTVNYFFKNVQSNSLTEDYFDFTFDDPVIDKGIVLTKMAKFWFDKTKHIVKNHLCLLY